MNNHFVSGNCFFGSWSLYPAQSAKCYYTVIVMVYDSTTYPTAGGQGKINPSPTTVHSLSQQDPSNSKKKKKKSEYHGLTFHGLTLPLTKSVGVGGLRK